MKILALEFSSPQRSVAVVAAPEEEALPRAASGLVVHPDSTRLVPQNRKEAGALPVLSPAFGVSVNEVVETSLGHTMKPLGLIGEALKLAGLEREQIECLAIGLGPGSYTGIRAAIALAQGWQLALGVRLLGVSSAECIAAQAQADGLRGRVTTVIDAQREEFYLATYDIDAAAWHEIAPLHLATMAETRERERAGETLVGPEAPRFFPAARRVFPRAAMAGTLALARNDFVPGEMLEPIYLRETQFVKAGPARTISP